MSPPDAARRWSEDLAAWAIPPAILDAAPESPFEFSVELFARAADAARAEDTPSRRRALEALPMGGSVLDVGCGAGAAAFGLLPAVSSVVGVDESRGMLGEFSRRAREAGIAHREVHGRWPEVSGDAGRADVVVCHHVLYNVAEIEPFVRALSAAARARVVVEMTGVHPLAWMNPIWQRVHGLSRPDRPTAEDAGRVLGALGLRAHEERRAGASRLAHEDLDHLVAFTRRRLCVGPERDEEIAGALRESPPPDSREIVTFWWEATEPISHR